MNVGNTPEGGQHEVPQAELVEVQIKTAQRAHYIFPDVAREAIERVLSENLASSSSLTLVNASGAALVLPTRIIGALYVEGELRWKAP